MNKQTQIHTHFYSKSKRFFATESIEFKMKGNNNSKYPCVRAILSNDENLYIEPFNTTKHTLKHIYYSQRQDRKKMEQNKSDSNKKKMKKRQLSKFSNLKPNQTNKKQKKMRKQFNSIELN